MKIWGKVNHNLPLLIVLLIFLTGTVHAQSSQISFIDNDLKRALEEAKRGDKLIFIDAYTTWCGPCKMMDREVFTDSTVAAFYNRSFVNLKLDMEKGDGLATAKKYQVRAYPSFLFIDASESLVHRGLGYQPVPRFLDLGQEATDPSRQIGTLAKSYDRGDRSTELQYNYALALLRSGDKKGHEIAESYLEQEENWATKKNMDLIRRMVRSYEDPYFNFMVQKKHLFIKEYGEGFYNSAFQNLLRRHYLSQIDKVNLKEVKAEFQKTFTASQAMPLYDLFTLDYYDAKGEKKAYVTAARDYVKKYEAMLSWNTLNGIAWNFYEKIDDPKALKRALKWAKKSVAKQSNHYNNDTLAALYFKLGKQKPATKYAERAIELAKQAGAPFEETKDLLEQIRQMSG